LGLGLIFRFIFSENSFFCQFTSWQGGCSVPWEVASERGFMSAKKHKKVQRRSEKTAGKPVVARDGKSVAGIPHALKASPPVQWAKAVADFFHLPSSWMPSKNRHHIQRINE
jgi:hypothetical protein